MIIPLVNPCGSGNPRRRISRDKFGRFLKKVRKASVRAKRRYSKTRVEKLIKSFKRPARRPPAGISSSSPRSNSMRKAHARRSRRRHNPRFGLHRPVLQCTGKKWHRKRRSKLFPWKHGKAVAVKINPRRRRRRHATRHNPVLSRYHYRRNPGNEIMQAGKEGLMIGAGIVLGMYGIRAAAHMRMLGNHRKYLGAGEILLGAVVAGSVENRYLRSLAVTVAGVGLYDLIACNVKSLHLPTIHTETDNPNGMLAENSVSLRQLTRLPPPDDGQDERYNPALAPTDLCGNDLLGASFQGNDLLGASFGDSDDCVSVEDN